MVGEREGGKEGGREGRRGGGREEVSKRPGKTARGEDVHRSNYLAYSSRSFPLSIPPSLPFNLYASSFPSYLTQSCVV